MLTEKQAEALRLMNECAYELRRFLNRATATYSDFEPALKAWDIYLEQRSIFFLEEEMDKRKYGK